MTNPYLKPAYVRAALHSLNLRPTRGMGQNFLINGFVLEQIVTAAMLAPDDVVVEVGPGLGVLTWELLQHTRHVIAVELDKRLAARLREEFAATVRTTHAAALHVAQGDILHISAETLLEQAGCSPPYKVVANLPYAITSPVLRHFLEVTPQPVLMVVLVQWEVAERITATAGDLSMLAHAVQMYALPEIVARVPADNFFPEPDVDSAILRLHVRSSPAIAVDNLDAFFRILKAGFLHARKKLSNALPSGLSALGEPYTRQDVIMALEAAGVSPDRRAETVTLEEWGAVYRALVEKE